MKQVLLLFVAIVLCASPAQSQYWQPVASGSKKNLVSVSFGSPQVGYISGADSLLLRTVDGGDSWHPLAPAGLTFSLGSPDIIHVNFTNAGTGYAIVGSLAHPLYTGVLYKTTDSGTTWSIVSTGNIAAARTFFFDVDNGFEIGSAFFAGKTVIKQTAGAWGTEQIFSFSPTEFLYGIDFRNSSTGIVGGHGGLVHRTFNGGITWDTVKTAVDSTINALRFVSSRTILAASDNDGGAILISHDTGRTWSIDMATLTFAYPDIKGLAVSARDSFVAVGHASFGDAGIILWQDGQFANNYMTPHRLNAVGMQNDSVAYIVGDSGTIYTNRRALLSVPGAVPVTEVRLFPNPAAGNCFTEGRFPHTVRLYDALGRLIWMEGRAANRHEIPLNGFCAGTYVLEAEAKGRVPAYHKLVVR